MRGKTSLVVKIKKAAYSQNVKDFSKNLIWAFIILMLISALYAVLTDSFKEKKEVTLSELVGKIRAGEVSEIGVTNAALDVTLKDGATVRTYKEAETGLTETLKNYGVTPEELQRANVKVKTGGALEIF